MNRPVTVSALAERFRLHAARKLIKRMVALDAQVGRGPLRCKLIDRASSSAQY